MGILSFLGIGKTEKRGATLTIDEVIARLGGSGWGSPMSGETVNLSTALRVSAVLACVKVIADGCATPQLNIYRQTKDGKRELATNIPEYRLLNRRPNEWQTSFEFRRTMTMHAALMGDGVAIKVKSPGSNRVRELIPVTDVSIDEPGRYQARYRCYDKFGLVGTFGPDDVLHIPNMRWELVKSLDVLNLAREAIGLSIAAERTQATLHSNGGRPAGILSSPQPLSAEAVTRLRAAWKEFTTSNRNGTAILDGDMTYKPLMMTGVDGQHIEQRRLQIEEVARAFGVFPIMIGHSDKTATYASAEAMFSAHERHTLAPWHELWRQRLDEFVLDGEGPLFAEFDTRYLTQGSMKDRAEWARTMIEMRLMTRNEVRDFFGMDSVDGGDEFWSPANISGNSKTGSTSNEDPPPAA
jgi:HK97 family phage portal protein